ncbi:unnamed protein product [Leuciscus chuanchicus]
MAVAAELCNFLHVKCHAHTLNLASQQALKLPTVSRLLGRVRRGESDICTLSEADISNAEDIIKALKPMNDATILMSEESSPTICLIAPLQAQLIQDTKDSIGESSMIKQAISGDLSKRYKGRKRETLFSQLLLLKRGEMYGRVIAEAASLEQEVRVEEEETPEHNTLREEETLTTEEEQHQSPSNKRKSSSSLLENLLGQTFTHARVQQQPMSAYARAEEEVTKYHSAPSLPLSEDPLSWWMMLGLLARNKAQLIDVIGFESNGSSHQSFRRLFGSPLQGL